MQCAVHSHAEEGEPNDMEQFGETVKTENSF